MTDAAHFDKKHLVESEFRPLLKQLNDLCNQHAIPHCFFMQVAVDKQGCEFLQMSNLLSADSQFPAGLSHRLFAAHLLMHPECDNPLGDVYLGFMQGKLKDLLAKQAGAEQVAKPERSHNEKLVDEILGRLTL